MAIAAPSAAWFSPRVNAVRAASSKPFPSGPGSRPATVTAPPRVSRAAASAAGGVPPGADAVRLEW